MMNHREVFEKYGVRLPGLPPEGTVPMMLLLHLASMRLGESLLRAMRMPLKERRRSARLIRRARQGTRKTLRQLQGAHFRWSLQGQDRP